ncbi:MAG: HDOD domain-containing protein [Candidatus Hydrogenedentes bacterium]|nr:HDOD domain-containing protein [Candidatus Hydrogenedentota bacterium]
MGKCPFCYAVLPQAAKAPKQGGVYGCTNCWNPCVARHEAAGVVCEPVYGFPDYRIEAVPPVLITRKVIPKLGAALENIPILPEVPRKVMAMAHDPLTNLMDIGRVINEDAVIAMKVLRAANSAFYACAHEIKSLDVACARLGLKMIVKVVHAAAGGQVYRGGGRVFQKQMEQTWRHALASAYCAAEIASAVSGVSTDDAFLAGLIHDVGRVVLLDIFTGRYGLTPSTLGGTLEQCLNIVEHYRAVAGLHVVQRWDLPHEFRASTLCSRAPHMAPVAAFLPLACVVSLADRMANQLGYACGMIEDAEPNLNPSLTLLHLQPGALEGVQLHITDQIESLVEALAA